MILFYMVFAEKLIERREKRSSTLKKLAMEEAIKLASMLKERFNFDTLYLNGSLARNTFALHSDIDFVVKGLKIEDFFKAHALLLRHSSFPVDLKPWEELAESHKDKIRKYAILL